MEPEFYVCPICGNVITKVVASSAVPVCCGQTMKLLVPNTEDGTHEKHVPVATQTDNYTLSVRVGSEAHPMEEKHHINFIYLETKNGGQIRFLTHGDKTAEAQFCCTKDQPIAVYAYCNIHGLWKSTVFYERRKNFFSLCCH